MSKTFKMTPGSPGASSGIVWCHHCKFYVDDQTWNLPDFIIQRFGPSPDGRTTRYYVKISQVQESELAGSVLAERRSKDRFRRVLIQEGNHSPKITDV